MSCFLPDHSKMSRTICVTVDPSGEVVDYVTLPYMWCNETSTSVLEATRKKADLKTLGAFIKNTRPDCCAVALNGMAASRFEEELQSVVDNLFNEAAYLRGGAGGMGRDGMDDEEDDDSAAPKADIIFMAPELCVTFAKYRAASAMLPDYSVELRTAAILALQVQDPLQVVGAMFNDTRDILLLPWHPLCKSAAFEKADRDSLYEALERVLVHTVNTVGVDANMLDQVRVRPLLPYVCGLGPAKAAALVTAIRTHNSERMAQNESGSSRIESSSVAACRPPPVEEALATGQWDIHTHTREGRCKL